MNSKQSQFRSQPARIPRSLGLEKGRRQKLKPLVSFLSVLTFYILLLTSSFSLSWADQVTIRPRACFLCEFINRTGCSVDDDCVDEAYPDEDTSFVSSNSSSSDHEGFGCDSVNFSDIDSIKIKARSRKTGLFGTINAWAIGHFWTDGEMVYFVNVKNNITLNTTFTTEVCTALTKDENGNNWTSVTMNNHGWGIRLLVDLGFDQIRLTWVEVVVYGTPAAVTSKSGGMVQDEDNKGIIEGGIAR
jgi:hypothetical protein